MKMCCLIIISGGWGSLVLLNQCSSDICISMENRIICLFRPLLLSLFNVPNQHIHRYSCRFNQSSVLVSWVGAWARIWNLIFLYSWFSCLM